jgi:DNA-binding transcriptional LysR family regulator
MDVDTRLLRYFVAVAEEGNLTRAAARLFVSQPALTKQIKQLEAKLGQTLFTRSRAGMALTDAGRALLSRAPDVLTTWDHALAGIQSAARVLRVGFIGSGANEATPRIIAEFGRRVPDWRVEMRQAAWTNPSAGLATGDVDVAFVRLPFPGEERLYVEVLFTEPRWVALPDAHPLADREEIAFEELWDEPFVAAPPETGAWRDYWLGANERDGKPRIGAVTDQPDDWLTAIATGRGIALCPASTARFYARPGVSYRPVIGVSPSRVAVAWTRHDSVVDEFVRCCLAISA